MRYIQYSQKQTFYCSIKLVVVFLLFLVVYTLIALYTGLKLPSFLILIPLVLGVLLIPIQALLFDWFQATGKSIEIKDTAIVYRYSPNSLFPDTDEVKEYNMHSIKNVKVIFRGITCLQTIRIDFKNNQKLFIMGFYIRDTDFRNILDAISTLRKSIK